MPATTDAAVRLLGLPPDQCGHAAARGFASMRVEPRRLAERAEPAAVDGRDAGGTQAVPREAIEISLPAASRIRHEPSRSLGLNGEKRVANVGTDLVRRRTDRRAQPRE